MYGPASSHFTVRDFTFGIYDRLLEAITENGYSVQTVAEHLETAEQPEKYVILRHDVDRKVDIARSMARLEAAHGIASTYYFRTSTFDPALAREMAGEGHEVGYHYEELARARGDRDRAHERFEAILESFRDHVDVTTACSHGSPLSRHLNLDMWDEDRPPESYDLLGEAYLSIETDDTDPALASYCSDTGRHWGLVDPTVGTVRTTDDVIALLESDACPRLYILAHPSRWSRSSGEFVERVGWDLAAEIGKQAARPAHRAQHGVTALASSAVQTTALPIRLSRQLTGLSTHDY